ncbi:biotin/lipoate--protein ligase family protein [uncultured Tateyamaria sp.]|uniref:biotin/lipoate--protein ligase family protein n=1 Tax=uncultured Tateyamaria sp. TaxID=455651 RepID=UPI002614AF82|nr:biotin/lipoate--protein ligase family protein [uncultured Tateyamaria sp.]
MTSPSFPPVFDGLAVDAGNDPFEVARAEAVRGCDAGLVVYDLGANTLRAALVFAPEVGLHEAVVMLPLCGVGFQNALGALAPPEVAVHLDWDGGIRVNGAVCGRLRMAASTHDPKAEPDWLVIGLELPLWPEDDDTGHTPNQTALYAEGCAEVDAARLLESWVKHTLVGINTWLERGCAPVHTQWTALAYGIDESTRLNGRSGTYLGVDEHFGMLLRDADTTHLIPLIQLLEGP